jgi:glycosyltransferase involved in cell wall biosynthesis
MKVLFVAPLPPPTTGQSLACQVLLDELHARGDDVTVININKASLKSGVGSIGRILEIAGFLWRLLVDRRRYDLVYYTPAESYAGGLKDLCVYLVLGRRLRHAFIHMHGGAGMRRLLSDEYPGVRAINAFFLRRMRGVVVLGRTFVSMYATLIPANRIKIVANFAQDDLFADRDSLRRKFLASTKLRVLYLSNLIPGKGYDDLLEAVALLSDEQRSNLTVDFAGLFESEEARQDFMHRISTLDCVKYHGGVFGEKKRDLLLGAHVFCLPTYYPYEGQPISILEAYAAGCAVVTTAHSGIPDVFEGEKNGVLVQARSPQSIAAALERVSREPRLVRRCALTNARVARRLYTRRRHLERLVGVLTGL